MNSISSTKHIHRTTFDSPVVKNYASTAHTFQDISAFLEYSLDQMLAISDAHAGSLFLWDEFKKGFVLKVARGPYPIQEVVQADIKLRHGILGIVGECGKGVLVTDVNNDDRFHDIPRQGRYRSHSFISLPLIYNNRLVGVINLTEKKNLSTFTREDLKITLNFSHHIAIALENLKNKNRLEIENRQLQDENEALSQTLKNQESLCAVGKISANLAHELNNPLDAIRRYVNLALEQSFEDSLSRSYLLKAKKGLRRAIGVIRGLLQFSREVNGNGTKTAEVHSVISNSIESVKHDPKFQKIEVEKNFCEDTLYVKDCGLAVVLSNLCRNSCQAMQGIGKISISTFRTSDGVCISVDDTGPGISDSDKARIFEPFFSTKSDGDGTGIGLALCQEIIEKSGGKIECSNTMDQGARFVITLPNQN